MSILFTRYRKITRQYPILIGSIPLRPVPSAPVASTSSFASTSKNENVTPESNVVPSTSSMNEFNDRTYYTIIFVFLFKECSK